MDALPFFMLYGVGPVVWHVRLVSVDGAMRPTSSIFAIAVIKDARIV